MAFRKWVWCRDTATGAHLDIDHRRLPALLRAGAVEVIDGYRANEGQDARPRPAKTRRELAEADEATPSEDPDTAAPGPVRRPRKATAPAVQPTETTSSEGTD